MVTTSADELLKGCNTRIYWDGHGYHMCGVSLVDKGITYCDKCKAKIAQSLAEKKEFLEFIETRVLSMEGRTLFVRGLQQEIKKLEEASK